MTPELTISKELFPFFKFATPANPSRSVSIWTEDQRMHMHLIYKNCVSCNEPRFKKKSLAYVRLGTNTYFCNPCLKQVTKIVQKYDKGIPSKENEIFNKLWNEKLFIQSKL